jgi:DNA-binding Lrp family transcriptional regulator
MDKIKKADKDILNELGKNARETIRNIAKKTKLRPSTVHSRMKKLEEEGVIKKYTLELDYKKLGKNLVVFILVNTNSNIPDTFFRSDEIDEVFGITGEYDLILKCRFSGVEEFNEFVIKLRNMQQVNKTLTMVGTIAIKS